MTVTSTTSKDTYNGDASTTGFNFTFRILAEGDLKVVLYDTTTGTESLQVLSTDYTVSGTGNTTGRTNYTSGTVTFSTAPSAVETVVITRTIDITQATDYTENDSFPAESHEEALDRLTMIAQETAEKIDRGLLASSNESSLGTITGIPTAGDYIRRNTTNDGFEYTTDTSGLNNLDTVTVATDDKVYISDTSDSGNKKIVTAQSIADLGGGGGGAWTYITGSTYTNSSGNAWDLVTGMSSSYFQYKIVLEGIRTDDAIASILGIRVGTGATPTWHSGASDYSYRSTVNGTISTSNSYSYIRFTIDADFGATDSGANIEITVFNPSQTTSYHNIMSVLTYTDGSYPEIVDNTGIWKSTTAITGIRLVTGSGVSFTAGIVKVYGLSNS